MCDSFARCADEEAARAGPPVVIIRCKPVHTETEIEGQQKSQQEGQEPQKEPLKEPRNVEAPRYQTLGAAGADVCAACNVYLRPGERALVPTGIILDIPKGYEVQVRSRSGLAWRDGVVVLNSPGTIDSDYHGELMVVLVNLDFGVGFGAHGKDYQVLAGDRIAQLVVAPVVRAAFVMSHSDADVTVAGTGGFGAGVRGTGGFGSTGC